MIAIVDYGAGNLASVSRGLSAVGADVRVVNSPDELGSAHGLVIPGVGHFAATRALDTSWRLAIHGRLAAGSALLGVCLGMQWLFDGSDESPDLAGLGLFVGRCFRLRPERPGLKVPHVGWNTVERTRVPSRLLDGIETADWAYFTHSFAAPVTEHTVATTSHGRSFASVVERDRVFGTQWHPEKSGHVGLRVLTNFAAIAQGGY